MAIVTNEVSWLREQIATNQELTSKIEEQLRTLDGSSSPLRATSLAPDSDRCDGGVMGGRAGGVNLYGFLDTVSGLGAVARSCVKALETAEIPLHKIDIPSWAEQVSKRSLPKFEPHHTNLILQNPDMLELFFKAYGKDLLKGCYNIGYWLWELASPRADWHHLYGCVDEIWVASDFCKLAFQSVTKLPVKRIPLVVEGLEQKAIYAREHFGLPRDVFVFGYIFDMASYFERKNPLCLVEAFKREFGNSGDLLLYLKYFNGARDENNVRALEEAAAGAYNIRTFSGIMDDNEIVSLQNSMDCLVSPHRSEGFGYNLAEAMYLGKPVIATRYSSNLDYMRDDNSYLIDCELVPIRLSHGPYPRGHVWAEPSIEHLCHLMRTVFEDSEGRREKGRKAAEEIRANYNARVAGRKIADRLEEIGSQKRTSSPTIFKGGGASRPLISVITPVYNVDAGDLRRSIESVRSQGYPFSELCICDDGSTSPETIEVLESYRGPDARIRIVQLPCHQGVAVACHRAAEFSTGDYLARLMPGDQLTPETLVLRKDRFFEAGGFPAEGLERMAAVVPKTRPAAQRNRSFKRYPTFPMKVAARLRTRELGLARPDYEALAHGYGLWRLFREHLQAARRAGGPQASEVIRNWHRALTSATLDHFRGKPRIPAEFDETPYLLVHPDVAERVAAGDLRSGYEHWARFGKQEGRLAHFRESPAVSEAVGGSAIKPMKHGLEEEFDEDTYLFLNADVAAAVEKGLFPSGYRHWVVSGRKEGRAGGPWEMLPDRSKFVELLESRPYGINLYGFLSTVSGVGASTRSFAQALETTNTPFQKISIPSWEEREAKRSLAKLEPYRANLLVQNPDMLPRFVQAYGADLLKGCYNIGYWAWELPSPRSDWHHLYRYVDEIWVGCEFVRHSFQALTRLPVKRMSLVVDGIERKAIYPRTHFGLPRDTFVFGYIFDVASHFERKNPLCLVEAFRREFGNSRDVLLYLKYFNGDHDQNNVRTLEEAVAGATNIRTYSGMMNESEIISLQNSMDCLVSPHRGEGFGYNMAEAMYLGKPVIATRYSSNLDYMRDDNSYLIDCSLVPIPTTIGPYKQGHLWADPSVDHLCHLMRTVFEDSEGRVEKGRRAAEEIRKNYSARVAGKKIVDRLEEIGLQRQRLSPSLFQAHGAAGQPKFLHEETRAAVACEIREWAWKPTISVIIAVHNVSADLLRRQVESVRSQDYPFWELCLCDVGSTSAETISTLERYWGTDPRIKIVRLEQAEGMTAATNRAAEFSTGDYLATLDQDAELPLDSLFEIVKALQINPDLDFGNQSSPGYGKLKLIRKEAFCAAGRL
jgi:glycosyltransferase involved in cell wall biosynthesis